MMMMMDLHIPALHRVVASVRGCPRSGTLTRPKPTPGVLCQFVFSPCSAFIIAGEGNRAFTLLPRVSLFLELFLLFPPL